MISAQIHSGPFASCWQLLGQPSQTALPARPLSERSGSCRREWLRARQSPPEAGAAFVQGRAESPCSRSRSSSAAVDLLDRYVGPDAGPGPGHSKAALRAWLEPAGPGESQRTNASRLTFRAAVASSAARLIWQGRQRIRAILPA